MLLEEDAGPLTDEQRRFLEIVMRSSQRLMRQVGDLLFISQLDSSGLTLHAEDVDLRGSCRDAVDQLRRAGAPARDRAAVDAARRSTLRCDRERIAQVVSNLLSNAIKFTPRGRLRRRCASRRRGDGVVEVEDSGIGIPDAERDRLFERFFRSSPRDGAARSRARASASRSRRRSCRRTAARSARSPGPSRGRASASSCHSRAAPVELAR